MKEIIFTLLIVIGITSCINKEKAKNKEVVNLKDTAYKAFIYAYPLLEQVKTLNGMFDFMGMKPNAPSMNDKFPMNNLF